MKKQIYTQDGRSMIEMLGVLAIIGVLSIGGIAGYSKAMTKYRINKTADQISQLAQNIRTLYASQKSYNTLSANVIKKAHLAPEDMYDSTSGTSLYHPFGGSVTVGFSGKNSTGDKKAFLIELQGVPQEACVELLSQDWGVGASSGLIAVGGVWNDGPYLATYGCSSGTSYVCPSSGVMPIDKAISICTNSPYMQWKFY